VQPLNTHFTPRGVSALQKHVQQVMSITILSMYS
jgi:hypothetical protein